MAPPSASLTHTSPFLAWQQNPIKAHEFLLPVQIVLQGLARKRKCMVVHRAPPALCRSLALSHAKAELGLKKR
ncbi:MAG: hypothetical protein NZM15_04290 [Flavobacteriales bacterium]|nr:hypothetical protein [Flavobacteriales bacterium]MDW8431904.1 hypothetical protein [Flavobacteriales bacterium]